MKDIVEILRAMDEEQFYHEPHSCKRACMEAADEIEYLRGMKALNHLGNVLHMLGNLHPADKCAAYINALEFYNKACPEKKIIQDTAWTTRLVTWLGDECLGEPLKSHWMPHSAPPTGDDHG